MQAEYRRGRQGGLPGVERFLGARHTWSTTRPTSERAEPHNNPRQVGLPDPLWRSETEAENGEAGSQGPAGKEQRWDLNPQLTGPERERLNAGERLALETQTLKTFDVNKSSQKAS